MDPVPQPATTVLLLHPESEGFSVFMVQRNRQSGFLPNAWVFPGGRVDDRDRAEHPHLSGGSRAVTQMGLSDEEGRAYLVAGVRETLEEAGIWLGRGRIPEEDRKRLAARGSQVLLEELMERHGAHADLDRLVPWSWWVTPVQERRRYDTRFLVAVVQDKGGAHDEVEVVDSRWVDPRWAADQGNHQSFPVAPPTWWTLKELARHQSCDEVLAAARLRPQIRIEPILRIDERGIALILPGHPEHPEPAVEGLPTAVGFDGVSWVPIDGSGPSR